METKQIPECIFHKECNEDCKLRLKEIKEMTLKEALKSRPLILCPFCNWNIPSHTQSLPKGIKKWKEHIKDEKCYKILER